MSINWWMDEQVVVYLHDETMLCDKSITDIGNNMDESQTHDANWKKPDAKNYIWFCLVTFWKRQSYRDRKKDDKLPGTRDRKRIWIHEETLRADENALYFNWVNGYMTVHAFIKTINQLMLVLENPWGKGWNWRNITPFCEWEYLRMHTARVWRGWESPPLPWN